MSSEWMKVMLEEIARKKDQEEQARLESELRRQEGDCRDSEPPTDPHRTPPGGRPPRGTPPE